MAGYGAAGAAIGAGVGWLGSGAAAVLGAETGPADIAIAYGGKVLSSAVGTYVGQQAGYLLGSIVCSSSTGTGGGGGAQDKKLSPSEIRQLEAETGESAHQIKAEALGTNRNIAQYDLYKDLQGNIFVKAKGGIGEAIPTGLRIR